MNSIGKLRQEFQTKESTSATTSYHEILQKLSNELVAMKRKLPRFNNSYQQNIQNQSSRNTDGKTLQLAGPQ